MQGFIKKRKDQPATQVVELPAKRTRRAAGQSIGITNEKFQATKEPGTRLTRSGSKNVVPDEAEESETPEPKRRIAKRTAVTKTKDKDKIQLYGLSQLVWSQFPKADISDKGTRQSYELSFAITAW